GMRAVRATGGGVLRQTRCAVGGTRDVPQQHTTRSCRYGAVLAMLVQFLRPAVRLPFDGRTIHRAAQLGRKVHGADAVAAGGAQSAIDRPWGGRKEEARRLGGAGATCIAPT